jgi:hypothetical protein
MVCHIEFKNLENKIRAMTWIHKVQDYFFCLQCDHVHELFHVYNSLPNCQIVKNVAIIKDIKDNDDVE